MIILIFTWPLPFGTTSNSLLIQDLLRSGVHLMELQGAFVSVIHVLVCSLHFSPSWNNGALLLVAILLSHSKSYELCYAFAGNLWINIHILGLEHVGKMGCKIDSSLNRTGTCTRPMKHGFIEALGVSIGTGFCKKRIFNKHQLHFLLRKRDWRITSLTNTVWFWDHLQIYIP